MSFSFLVLTIDELLFGLYFPFFKELPFKKGKEVFISGRNISSEGIAERLVG